jgi:hypothetical protein
MLSAAIARVVSDSPVRIELAASHTALMPDAQAMLIVCDGTGSGMPALKAICRPGFGPLPAWRQFATTTSPMSSALTPALSSAARPAIPPSSTTRTSRSEPPYRPCGVRAAPTM